jgi:hypothetical protein
MDIRGGINRWLMYACGKKKIIYFIMVAGLDGGRNLRFLSILKSKVLTGSLVHFAASQSRLRRRMMANLSEICKEIGCSGVSKKCPGNPLCDILRKIVLKGGQPC